MAQPLEYRNAKSNPPPESPRPAEVIQAAIPADFDLVLTRSDDHAAVRAIENELRHQNIPVFRAEDKTNIDRPVQLMIRAADRDRAVEIAGKIFARRKRIKAFPRQKPIPDYGPAPGGLPPLIM
jgi:hypothetical protein